MLTMDISLRMAARSFSSRESSKRASKTCVVWCGGAGSGGGGRWWLDFQGGRSTHKLTNRQTNKRTHLGQRVQGHGQHGARAAEEVERVDGAAGEVDGVVEVRECVRLRPRAKEPLAVGCGGIGSCG